MKRLLLVVMACLLCVAVVLLVGCQKKSGSEKMTGDRVEVMTTLFPVYDFVRIVGGDRVAPVLLLPPGVEPHSFEPRPDDMKRIAHAKLFVYTHKEMEPWAVRLFQGMTQPPAVLEAGAQVPLLPVTHHNHGGDHHHGHKHEHHSKARSFDPHIWLDPHNAVTMVQAIRDELIRLDAPHAQEYRKRAEAYIAQLVALDQDFKMALEPLTNRTIIHGGHYAFGYLAKRYNLDYHAAVSVHANAEPSSADLAALIRGIRSKKIKAIFSEELVSPRISETLAKETGAKVYQLKNGHNITKADMDKGVGYIDIMRYNLKTLREGLSR